MAKDFWDSRQRPIMIAHRGGNGAGKAKENTYDAFKTAQDLGYKYFESDLVLAASGELILIHGSANFIQASIRRDIVRNTIQKMTLEQIRSILKPGGCKVPTLEEVLKTFPKAKFILDLKTDEVVEPLAKLIKRLKVQDRICVCGFSYRRTEALKLAFADTPITYALTIGRGVRFRNMNLLMLKSGRLKGVDAIFLHHSLISSPMVNLVHSRGFKVFVWTANSSLGIKHAIRSGVDGIMSDRIQLLTDIIQA